MMIFDYYVFALVALDVWFVPLIYVALAAAFGFAFIIYNRGFATKNVTPDQLPNTMTKQEKLAYMEEGKARLDRSRWMLTVILPTILAIAIDLTVLFILPHLQEIFS